MRHLAVLPHTQHVVSCSHSQHLTDSVTFLTLNGGRVPHEEHSALPLRHEQVLRVLPRHGPEVPAEIKGQVSEL